MKSLLISDNINIFSTTPTTATVKPKDKEENFEITDSNSEIELSKDELKTYGQREPRNYRKVKLLGK